MESLLVDTELAARTLALEIQNEARVRAVVVIGIDQQGEPLVSANRLTTLISPRIATVTDADLATRFLANNEWRQDFDPSAVSVYLPGSPRTRVVARGSWTPEAEDTLRRLLSINDGLTASIFKAWSSRCVDHPVPLPPFALTDGFLRALRTFPTHARDRLACACLDALVDSTNRTTVSVKPLPTGITHVKREWDGKRILLCGVTRARRKGSQPR